MQIKNKIIITIIVVSFFIPTSIFFPQMFLVFYLNEYETNSKCNELGGDWDWLNNICEDIPPSICKENNGTRTCGACWREKFPSPWSTILPIACLDACKLSCTFSPQETNASYVWK